MQMHKIDSFDCVSLLKVGGVSSELSVERVGRRAANAMC